MFFSCGWCVRATLSDSSQHAHKDISEDELSHIKHVVDRAQNMDSNEQQRIGCVLKLNLCVVKSNQDVASIYMTQCSCKSSAFI